MRRLLVAVIAVLTLSSHGCIMPVGLSLTDILLLSAYYNHTNYTVIEGNVLGDDQTVFFYLEARDFKKVRTNRLYEFWISVDISIGDEHGNVYVEEISEKEIHVTNATEKPGMVWYTYIWFTGTLVLSGNYWVSIVVKDKLSGRVQERRRDFYVDL